MGKIFSDIQESREGLCCFTRKRITLKSGKDLVKAGAQIPGHREDVSVGSFPVFFGGNCSGHNVVLNRLNQVDPIQLETNGLPYSA